MANMFAGLAMQKGRAAARVALIAALAGVAAACSSTEETLNLNSYVDTIEPADALYNQGLANLNSGQLREAQRKFDAVDRQHPYSEFARKANVMSAFTSYKLGKYDDAVQAARRFVNLYPTDEDAPYAQYIIGLSYFNQMPEVTRDQRDTKLALQNFNELLERYPGSIYEDDARTKIRAAKDQLAGKEMQVGRYYLERRQYPGAINRFRIVVEQFSDTRHVEEALARLTETYYAMGLVSEAQTAAAVLGHNFPDSQWYRDSYVLLQSGGLEPRENTGSWISRIGKSIIPG
jgi:outer membrane protein assembly factor BamD